MKTELAKAKNKLWIACSKFIKQRDGRKCFTCGKDILPGKGLHVGHMIPSHICGPELRYDEDILAVQCYYCNINLGGNGAIFYRKLVKKLGQKKIDEIFKKLEEYQRNRVKWKIEDYNNKYAYYSKKLTVNN